MATYGVPGRSSSVKPRPCRIGTPIVAKYSGETVVTSIDVARLADRVAARHPDVPAIDVDREGHARGERRRFDAGDGAHARERLVEELPAPLAAVAQHAGIHRHDGQAVGLEAEAGVLGGDEAARQQRGDDEQHRRDRHLRGDQHVAERPAVARRPRDDRLAAQIGGQVRPRRLQRRREAGDDAGDERRDEGEREHAADRSAGRTRAESAAAG